MPDGSYEPSRTCRPDDRTRLRHRHDRDRRRVPDRCSERCCRPGSRHHWYWLPATETVATTCRTLTATLTRTMLAPLTRLRTGALARTTTETSTLAAALTRAAAATTFAIVIVVGVRTVHRMRTRNVTRSRGMHALLAAERIVTRTWARSVRLRTIGGIVAIAALRSIGIVIVALCARSRNRSRLAALTAFALRTRSVAVGRLPGWRESPGRGMRWPGFGASDLDAAGRAGFGAAGFAADAAGAAGVARGAGVGEAAGAAGFLAGTAGFLDSDALPCALEAKAFLSLRATRRFNGRRCGLHKFAHRLKFVQNSLAVNGQVPWQVHIRVLSALNFSYLGPRAYERDRY